MTTLIANERLKLGANALDRASTACVAVGVFAPAAGLLQGQAASYLWVGFSFIGWLVAAAVLHLVARSVLGGLKP